MLQFYGFEPHPSGTGTPILDIKPADNFDRAAGNWIRRFDHNHLRMTRMIRSLRVLGLEEHALLFFRVLSGVYDEGRSGISAKTMMFWTRAAERPLYLAPEDEEDEGRGKDFLYEYEASRRAGATAGGNGNGEGGEAAGEGGGAV